jgi:hypothetical protein
LEELRAFCDPVYLHQVKLRDRGGDVHGFGDLPAFLEAGSAVGEIGAECRVHCHVPLYFAQSGAIASTRTAVTDAFLRELLAAGEQHLEIETYTFDVLPPELKQLDVTESIAREYEWVRERIRPLL